MGRSIKIVKSKILKEDFDKVIDRNFKTFGVEELQNDKLTVEEFFANYETLFKEIPIEGESNSHEYLIKESSKLIEVTKDTADIQPFLDEITNLRTQLLSANERIIELTDNQIVSD